MGIAIPPIGALLKLFVAEAVFVFLCIAFLRIDSRAFRTYVRHPATLFAATAWTSLVIPTLFGVACLAFGLKDRLPELFLTLVLQGIASPMMAAPALAALMGLDATLVLTLGFTAFAFVVLFSLLFLTTLLFTYTGRNRALSLGFTASQRNMGLMLAATTGVLPDLTWLYFALSQFPIYLSPNFLQPLIRRMLSRSESTDGEG